MKKLQLLIIIMQGMIGISFSACNGILEDIYDNTKTDVSTNGFGFIEINEDSHSGTIYVHTEDYKKWIYVSLLHHSVDSTFIENESGEETPLGESGKLPENWDFAIHRYDVKTNGGAVLETSMTHMDEVTKLTALPQGEYEEDLKQTTDKIAIDMSGMMEGVLKYARSDFNAVLSKWIDVDKSQMPPIYTLSGYVYMLRLSDGSHAALLLEDFKNAKNVKGYMKVKYIYPVERVIKK